MRLCIVQPALDVASETFLQAHRKLLPFDTTVIHFENNIPCINRKPILSRKFIPRVGRKLYGKLHKKNWDWEITEALISVFRKHADVVLAEYGTTGVLCYKAAKMAKVPLVTHFHGFDASCYDILEQYQKEYGELFRHSSAIVSVSKKMVEDLIQLGAPENKIYLNPCGVDTNIFSGTNVVKNDPILVSVGRFVEKKAPYLTILAFRKALENMPEAKLMMLGGGPLEGICIDLAFALGISSSVDFLGECPHKEVREVLRTARAFVQHSIKALDGDCEGTPVGVLEAQAMGIPVVATRHAGIADVILHGETGFLVKEKDVNSMARYMVQVLEDPVLAGRLGRNGRERIKKNYSMTHRIEQLGNLLSSVSQHV